MVTTMGRRILAFAATAVLATACSPVAEEPPQVESQRYQLQKDSRGRLVRLDTSTGEVALVESSGEGVRKGSPVSRAARTKGAVVSRESQALTNCPW